MARRRKRKKEEEKQGEREGRLGGYLPRASVRVLWCVSALTMARVLRRHNVQVTITVSRRTNNNARPRPPLSPSGGRRVTVNTTQRYSLAAAPSLRTSLRKGCVTGKAGGRETDRQTDGQVNKTKQKKNGKEFVRRINCKKKGERKREKWKKGNNEKVSEGKARSE